MNGSMFDSSCISWSNSDSFVGTQPQGLYNDSFVGTQPQGLYNDSFVGTQPQGLYNGNIYCGGNSYSCGYGYGFSDQYCGSQVVYNGQPSNAWVSTPYGGSCQGEPSFDAYPQLPPTQGYFQETYPPTS